MEHVLGNVASDHMKSLLYGYEGKLMHLKFLSGNESRLVIWADCMKYMNFNVPFSISSEYMMRITQYLHRFWFDLLSWCVKYDGYGSKWQT